MNRIVAAMKLVRIEHSLMLAVAVVAAEIISGGLPGALVLGLSLATPVLISMGSFALNDYFDVAADKINKRKRPIVTGAITKGEALAIGAGTMIIGVAASAFINIPALAVAVIFAVLAALYSYRLKDTTLVGNTVIALSMAIPFIYGNFVMETTLRPAIVMVAIVVFLSGVAREIHGMIRDRAGDAKARRTRNLVHTIGAKRSAYAALALYLEAIGISIYMFFAAQPFAHNAAYIVPILAVDAALLYVALGFLKKKQTRRFFDRARNISLGAMAASILIFLVSALVYIYV